METLKKLTLTEAGIGSKKEPGQKHRFPGPH